jgi:hypothetical protein
MPAAKIPSAMGSGIYRLFQPTQLTTPQLSYLSRGWNGLFTKNGTGFEAIAWESNTHTHTRFMPSCDSWLETNGFHDHM